MSATAAWPPGLFAGHRYAVVGLGRNGLPAARALQAMGADVVAWDDTPAGREGVADLVVRDPIGDIAGFDALVLSPGIPHALPVPHPLAAAALRAGVPIVSDAELLFQAAALAAPGTRFAGITGTNGKSTTTALLAHVLAAAGLPVAAGGNLGPAALALPVLPSGGVYVLEMSSYMLERLVTLRFSVAAMLNLSADHLDRHGDMAGYASAKRQVFARQDAGCTAVLGVDDAASRAMADALHGPRVVRVSGDHPADLWAEHGTLRDADGPIMDLRDAPALPGAHNAQNAAAAAALALALGVPRAALPAAIASFPGLPHRQQRVGEVDGIAFVNDSKATNADATACALACYGRVVWIAGGTAKAGGIASLRPLLGRVAHALLIGRDAPLLAETLREAGVPYSVPGTLEAAMPAALDLARGLGADTVLLSPACASWDQFSGFEQRGECFAALAASLVRQRAA